jgi:hypothetical protein
MRHKPAKGWRIELEKSQGIQILHVRDSVRGECGRTGSAGERKEGTDPELKSRCDWKENGPSSRKANKWYSMLIL